jgi:hypothetical protein
MIQGMTEKVVRRVVTSKSMTTALREVIGTPEFRNSILEVVRSPEFFQAIFPHIVQQAYHPDLRGMDLPGNVSRVDKGTQILLMLKYRELVRTGAPLPSFEDVGFRSFSQFDEDGILLYIFSLIGMTTRTAVEVCAGVGYECNSANLIINHGFYGLLFDGNPENVEKAKGFFAARPDTLITPPVVAHAWIEADNINDLVRGHQFTGEIDLLSVDMDGIDYWVWDALTVVQPRVVVVEYHTSWGPDEAMTVPNVKGFQYSQEKGAFCGASLAAFNKLANKKGYRLVGCNRNRINAFFVRRGLGDELLPEVSVASCIDYYRNKLMWDAIRSVILKQDWQAV